MIKKRNTHTAEFKAKVALEAVRGMQTVNELAQHYGVHPVQVGQWKRALLDQAAQVFETKRGPKAKAEAQSEDRLYSEIGRLKMELDWLKKNLGSAYDDPYRVDRGERIAPLGSPVCLSGCGAFHGVCAAAAREGCDGIRRWGWGY